MKHYDFEIAELLLRVTSEIELNKLFELQPYHRPYSPDQNADLHYHLHLLPDDWTIRGTYVAGDEHSDIYDVGDEIHRYYYWSVYSRERYVLVRRRKEDRDHFDILLQPAYLQRILPQFRLAAFLCPEEALLSHRAIFLHASVIDWHGQGILFTGPSGVGKSTQASLWERLEGAQVINGDRGIMRYQDNILQVYGSPYAGTSRIYTTGTVPVRCIVLLSQAPENSIRCLSPREAFFSLYQQCTIHPWDPWFVDHLSILLQQIVSHVEIYHLTCRPDDDAVSLLKKTLE